MMRIFIGLIAGLAILFFLGWLGLQIQPKPFPAYPEPASEPQKMTLPAGLPAPVERFYREAYGGDQIPVITSAVFSGRAVIRPILDIPLPARFIFVHQPGQAYRHYIEATWFGIPFMKVDEGYVDNASFFEGPMGTYHDEPNTNQGANLAVWAEAGWFPSVWLTDPRARWAAVDERTALLYVPFEDQEETFVVRFNPETGLIDTMEAMRYRDPGEGQPKILWITRNEAGPTLPGSQISTVGSAMWLDQGKPWATFTLENTVFNADVSTYIRQRGQ